MSPSAEPPPYVHLSKPNRSLGTVARRWALGAIGATTMTVAFAAAAFGAWPVLPFAGLEVALVALAFHALGRHDRDFERLEIGEHEVRLESCEAGRRTRFVAARAWARLVVSRRGTRCSLALAYAGRRVPLGRLLTDDGRRELAESLRRRIAVTAY